MIDDAFDNVRNYVDNFLAHPANATIILLDFIFAIVERSEVAVVLLYIPWRRGKRGTNWIEEERGTIDNQFLDCSHTAHCNKSHLAFWLSRDIGRSWKSKRIQKSVGKPSSESPLITAIRFLFSKMLIVILGKL